MRLSIAGLVLVALRTVVPVGAGGSWSFRRVECPVSYAGARQRRGDTRSRGTSPLAAYCRANFSASFESFAQAVIFPARAPMVTRYRLSPLWASGR